MCKKLICLVSFLFVLGVTAGVTNADIIAYWPFDEGTGNVAHDVVGNHDGQFTGTPTWISPGQLGAGALGVDGSNYVNCGTVSTAGDITVALWIKADGHAHQRPIAASNGDYSLEPGWMLMLRTDDPPGGLWFRLHGSDTGGWAGGDIQINETVYEANTWVHMVITFDSVTREMNGYINGELRGTNTAADGRTIANTVQDLRFGNTGTGENYSGALDEVAIWDTALTPEEVLAVYTLGPLALDPRKAGKPNPDDEATDVLRDVTLSWTPGEFAALTNGHKVYFGESFNDVNDATGGVAQSATSYAPGQRLDFNTTYYWRVDEVNAPPTSHIEFKGEVWQFTTEPIAYPIDGNNITATASSTGQEGTGPENTINGSGLDDNDLHSAEPADMWLSSDEPNGAWIEYELDKVHKLHQMWVWNSNQMIEFFVGFGLKDVTIEYSTNGIDYTTLGTTHEFVRAPGAPDYAHNTTVDFSGIAAKYVRLTANSNWGGVMPQYGLSEVRFFSIPVFARKPSPDSGATDVDVDVVLGFRAGREADTHDVYFSSDEQAVIDGNVPVTTVTETSYGPLSLDLGTAYYWKINEVNEAETTTTRQGDIWNFTTQKYFVVDDFEDYNDYPPDEIWSTWIDGYGVPTNGATVGYPDPDFLAGEHYVETATVHGGSQAMPFFYSNTGTAAYSEGERTFAVPQDWTAAGVQMLALYFHGSPGNTGQLYVKVNGSKVVYDGDAADIEQVQWNQWSIDLASLGINPQNVTNMSIGIDGSGASGTLYFDDIRLYRLAPEPEDN
jgi:hypothetical protein